MTTNKRDIRDSIMSYAMVLRLPVSDIGVLEQFIAEQFGWSVVYRQTSGNRLYIADEPPDMERESLKRALRRLGFLTRADVVPEALSDDNKG